MSKHKSKFYTVSVIGIFAGVSPWYSILKLFPLGLSGSRTA